MEPWIDLGSSAAWINLGYVVSAALFIFGLKKLGHPRTAPTGNLYGAMGMLVAVLTTVLQMGFTTGIEWALIAGGILLGGGIGYIMALRARGAVRDVALAG